MAQIVNLLLTKVPQKILASLVYPAATLAAGLTVQSSDIYLLLLFPTCPSPVLTTGRDSLSLKPFPFNSPSPSGQREGVVAWKKQVTMGTCGSNHSM